MFSALDKDGNIIFAEDCPSGAECFCKACGEQLKLKKGKINRPHFAHMPNTDCSYDDRDNKTEWHIRMQEYFPKETREYLFIDAATGERHIADIYIPEKETVIEFQHSAISEEEFLKRTVFHVSNHRKIVWVFDETAANPKEGDLGRLRPDDLWGGSFPYNDRSFRWQRQPRKCLQKGPRIVFNHNWEDYAIYIYSGVENGDYLHRIIGQDCNYEYVTLSVHTILLSQDIDVEDFFRSEQYWLDQSDWKPIMDEYRAYQEERKRMMSIMDVQKRRAANAALDRLLFSGVRRGRPRL